MKFLLIFGLLTAPAFALAQTQVWDSTKGLSPTRDISSVKKLGWNRSADISANLSFSSSQNVIGQTDGNSQTYGGNAAVKFDRVSTSDQWRNQLSYTGAASKNPSVPTFLKSSDELKFGTTYLYSLPSFPKVGPYVRGVASAPIFAGRDVQSSSKTYSITHVDNSVTTATGTSLRLSDGFKPLTTKEAVGFFYNPVETEKIKLELRAGFAGMQVSADGQYAVTGTAPDGSINVKELENVSQAGLELAAALKGKINDHSGYEASLETLTPFINNKMAGDNRNAIELTNVDGSVKLTSKITSWADFGYTYTVKIQPQLLVPAQQIHMLALSLNYNLF